MESGDHRAASARWLGSAIQTGTDSRCRTRPDSSGGRPLSVLPGGQDRDRLEESSAVAIDNAVRPLAFGCTRVGTQGQQGRDGFGMLALVRTTGHRQRCLLVADRDVQVEPFAR